MILKMKRDGSLAAGLTAEWDRSMPMIPMEETILDDFKRALDFA